MSQPEIAYNLNFAPVEDDAIVREIDFQYGILHCFAQGGWESVTEAKEEIFAHLLIEVFRIFNIIEAVEVTIDTLLYSEDLKEAFITVKIEPLSDPEDLPF